jgi:hypothetical protein
LASPEAFAPPKAEKIAEEKAEKAAKLEEG